MPVTEEPGAPGEAERLRRIEALTDAALGEVAVEALLTQVLERVRELLDVQTAVVLLLDEGTGDLVATAAIGLEAEVRRGVRVRVGSGFAGQVASGRRPIVLDDIDRAVVDSPILLERGLRSLLGVPLVVDGRLIGVLHVGSTHSRHFEPDEVHLLEGVAERLAAAVEARRSLVEQAAASALQRSLIPDRLPTVPGLEMAARYLPAGVGGVGGDWYDVFVLPSGHVGVVMGDVIGRGLEAAVVMGRLRSALRSYALTSLDPAEVLARLDKKIQHFEAGKMTTVLYAVLDPTLGSVEVASAGHPLPMMARVAGEPARMIDAAVDPPLGVIPGLRRRSSTVDLPPGALLVLYTDGLVERRGETLDKGFERLAPALAAGSAEASCARAIEVMLGDEGTRDDTALLVLRREDPAGDPLRLEVRAEPPSLAEVHAALRRWLAPLWLTDQSQMMILLAVGEAVANAVEHAYGPEGGTVEVELAAADDRVVATVRDHGRWRGSGAPDGSRGRGMRIMRACTVDMAVDTSEGGTVVRLEVPTAVRGPA
jgi:serine phosphatase RsbU (regulator of sigma subunit)/anti-sigma regulatory factor (Ser/Thr protein kinase)